MSEREFSNDEMAAQAASNQTHRERRAAIEMSDLRRYRAQHFAAAIMREIQDVVSDADYAAIHDRLLHVLHQNGAEIMTDQTRAEMGLEPRDNLGWTPSERVRHEQEKQRLMLCMAPLFIKTE